MYSERILTALRKALPVMLVFLFEASCTVKESREDCPCALYIRLESLPLSPARILVTGEGFRQELEVSRDTVLVVRPPKSGALVRAVAGATLEGDETVNIPYGYDSPPVYLFGADVDTSRDTAAVNIVMQKHFCGLTILFDGPEGWGEPYWSEVRGKVDAIRWDGTPIEGSFSCRLDSGQCIRLPRQRPEQLLLLDITMPDRIVRSFNLGYYLEEAGFSWTAPDLEDLTLEIQLSVTALTIRADNWSRVIPLEIIV